jgi:hypothetical protein
MLNDISPYTLLHFSVAWTKRHKSKDFYLLKFQQATDYTNFSTSPADDFRMQRQVIKHAKYKLLPTQWPNGLRRWSAAARLLGLWVRIPPGEWIYVSWECCVLPGRGLCVGPSLVKGSPTECGVSECDLETPKMRRPRPARAVEPWKKSF